MLEYVKIKTGNLPADNEKMQAECGNLLADCGKCKQKMNKCVCSVNCSGYIIAARNKFKTPHTVSGKWHRTYSLRGAIS